MNYELKKIASIMMDIDTEMSKQKEPITDVKMFQQTWSSTALGFGGWGGSAMTDAYTTIITTADYKYYVFFNGRIAYVVENPTQKFKEDMLSCNMADCEEAKTTY